MISFSICSRYIGGTQLIKNSFEKSTYNQKFNYHYQDFKIIKYLETSRKFLN